MGSRAIVGTTCIAAGDGRANICEQSRRGVGWYYGEAVGRVLDDVTPGGAQGARRE